jgi:2-oxoglutarate dehydrogenase E2 component (dihydrolipoamide succinyltransferase)
VITVDGEEAAAPAPIAEPGEPARAAPTTEPDAAAATGSTGSLGPRRAPDGTFLSPAVRTVVAQTGIDVSAIQGSGAGGRVTRRDVDAAAAEPTQIASQDRPGGDLRAQFRTEPARPAAGSLPTPTARPGDTVIPFSPIRRRTATHMVASLATSAHTLVVTEVDYANVDRVRQPAREEFRNRHGFGLTYLPFIVRSVVDGIAAYPQINASVGDDELIVRTEVNIGVAVDLDFEGLIVPVVHDADRLRLPALAEAMADLAQRARAKDLRPADVERGTFTLTNAGGYGTLLTAPVINQPQVAILATDGVRVSPVAVEQPGGGYALGFHPTGNLCLSFDHRAFDGAYASAFLAHVREHLQHHDWGAEL